MNIQEWVAFLNDNIQRIGLVDVVIKLNGDILNIETKNAKVTNIGFDYKLTLTGNDEEDIKQLIDFIDQAGKVIWQKAVYSKRGTVIDATGSTKTT